MTLLFRYCGPRIVTDEADITSILRAVDNPHNGLTFYAGSLGTGEQNDTRELARKFAKRTHFVHLRSTKAMPAVVDDELLRKICLIDFSCNPCLNNLLAYVSPT